MRIFQKGFNFNQDGPGNRLVYHLSGCNMRCKWCSNPEGMKIGVGMEYSVKEIFDEILRSRMMFFSGGGVTFTGGEATLQEEELTALLKLLKKECIHTVIETNATSKKLPQISEFIDYLIMDFKHYESNILKKYTGIGNEQIKKNFETLVNCREQLHVRIPLINNINTQNPAGFAEYFSSFNTNNAVFEFLPYHEYGKDKWTGEYEINDGFVSDEVIQGFYDTFQSYNLKIVAT